MKDQQTKGFDRAHMLYYRQHGLPNVVSLGAVEPEQLEEHLSDWFGSHGCSASSTQILRVERHHQMDHLPSPRGDDRTLELIARTIELAEDELAEVLAEAWAAAASEYRTRPGNVNDRPYVLHDFTGSFPVRTGAASGVLTCVHPALVSPAPDVFPVIGEARLGIGEHSLVLEFDGEIDEMPVNWREPWPCVSLERGQRRVPRDFPHNGWFVVESVE